MRWGDLWSESRTLRRQPSAAAWGIVGGLILLTIGTVCLSKQISDPAPLIGGEEFGPAVGGERLEGGGRARPGQLIKPSGTSVKGLAFWIFGVAFVPLGLLVVSVNGVDLARLTRRRMNRRRPP